MSFEPIRFVFTPPPTIPSQALSASNTVTAGVVAPVSNEFGSSIAASSNAASLVVRLTDLANTSLYLQQALLSLVPRLGITFDLASNPDLGRSLSRIYNTPTAPSAMDMQMYTSLLQTDVNFSQFDLLNAKDSSVQIEPIQRADIGLASKTFENSLISSGIYNQMFPVLLRSLAGDQIVFNSWSNALRQYPILSIPQKTPVQLATTIAPVNASSRDLNGSSVDVSDSVLELTNGILDKWEKSYAGMYKLVASPDPTEVALPSIVASLSTQPSSDLNRLVAMLQNLIAFQHQPSLQQHHDSIDNLVLPKLLSESIGHISNLDYMSQVAVNPSNNFGGSLGTLMSLLASFNPGSLLNIGLTGIVAQGAGGFSPLPLTNTQLQALSGLPEGLRILGANITWSTNESNRQTELMHQSMQRLGLRRLTNQGNQTELLTSMKSLSSSITIIKSILQSSANTPTVSGNTSSLNTNTVTPTLGLESFGTLVKSLQSQSGSSFALDGNTLIITPPQIPTASTRVQTVLARGGVNQITTQALRTPINLKV
jgi:hypothetical protein